MKTIHLILVTSCLCLFGCQSSENKASAVKLTVTASSEQTDNTAAAAVDGQSTTRWCAADSKKPQWLAVDLGQQTAIENIQIMWEQQGPYSYTLESSSNGEQWHVVKQVEKQRGQVHSHAVNTAARHLRVTVTGTAARQWASIYEVQVNQNTITADDPSTTPDPSAASTPDSTPAPPTMEPEQRNAFISHHLWPDTEGVHINAHGGGILFHEGTYYWYGEYKIPGMIEINQTKFDVTRSPDGGVSCYSSKDLMNWKNHGVVLSVDYKDPESDIAYGCVLERPKVIYNELTSKYVMWFHLELKGERYKSARTAVAVADHPTGPFTFIRSSRPQAGVWPLNKDEFELKTRRGSVLERDFEGGQMARDMTLFVDDDGKAYHIYSSEENSTLHISELSPDFQSYSGRYVRVLPDGHNEAPAICKHDGRYWLVASGLSGWNPNAARAAVADHIFGPWQQLENPTVGVNPNNQLGPEKTFGGQSTFILPVNGKPGAFIAMFDIWRPKNPIDGRYIWLPIQFEEGRLKIEWKDEWDLSFFD